MSIAAISIVFAAASVVAARTFYSFQIRNQTRVRKTDLRHEALRHLGQPGVPGGFPRGLLAGRPRPRLGTGEPRGRRHVGSYVFYFYDQVGALLRRKLIEFDLVDDLLGNSTRQLWEKVEPVIREARERSDDPRLYEHFEFLYQEMMMRAEPTAQP